MGDGTILAIVISGAAFLMSVFGPLLTALVTGKHEEKMYAKRFKTEHEHQVIERYLQSVGKYLFSKSYDDIREFGESSAEIFMYTPKELWDDIRSLNEDIFMLHRCNFEERELKTPKSQKKYFALCEKFSSLRRSSKHQHERSRRKRK